MRVSVSFICERCGAEFGSRSECQRHEAFCGDYPEDGLYRSKEGGMSAFYRVDRDNMRVVRLLIADTHLSVRPLDGWNPPEDLEPVSEGSAMVGIHTSFSDLEGACLSVLGITSGDVGGTKASARTKGARA